MTLFDLFNIAGKPVIRLTTVHDYVTQWDGHRVTRAAVGNDAFVTGHGLRSGDVLVLPDGRYTLRDVLGCDYSDLFMVTLEPEA